MKPKFTFVRYRVSRRCMMPGILSIALAMALATKPARAASGSWNVDAGGSWGTAGNWTPAAVPGTAISDVITFNNNIGAARTVTLDGNRTMGDLNIGDSTSTFFGFTLNAGTSGSLIMDVTTGSASIDFLNSGTNGAANTIGAGITMNDALIIRSNNSSAQTFGGAITDNTLSLGITFNNDVNGTAAAAASNQGQIVLSSVNTYDGGTSISDVRVGASVAGAYGTGAVNITGAGQAYPFGGTHTNTFNLNSTGWVEGAGNLGSLRIEGATLSGTINLQRDSSIGVNSGTGTITGAIAGPFNLTKIRGALLVNSGTNTYTGITTVNDGQLRFGSAGAIGNSPTVIVENPANPATSDTNTLQLSGGITLGAGRTVILRNNSTSNIPNARTAFENNSGNNTWLGSIVLDRGVNQTLTSTAGLFTIAGNISQSANPSTSLFIRGNGTGNITGNINLGTGQIAKTDGGSWTISSTGNVHGTVALAAGSLIVNATNALNPTSTLVLGEGNGNNGRLTINAGFTQTFGVIGTTSASGSAGGHVIDGAGALDVGAAGKVITVNDSTVANDLTITAPIIGAGGITKAGLGNLVLNNVTSGPVAVSAGTLTSSATFNGLSMASGTTLVPGTLTSAGTLTTSSLALTDGTIEVNLGSSGSDAINVTNAGGLTQAGTTTLKVTPNGGFNPASTFYPVINYSGTSPGVLGFAVAPLPGRLVGTVTDNGSSIGITATNDRVIWTGAAANGNWDVNTTSNWKKQSDSSATNFLSQDDVIFNDDGIAQNSINLTGTINPSRIEFAQSAPNTYILASGTLSGEAAMPFVHSGAGITILRNTNTFSGPLNITAGTVELDHSTGTLTATSGVNVTSGATFKLSSPNVDFTFGRVLAGNGTVTVNPNASGTAASRQATISGNNSGFSGTLDLAPSGNFTTNGTFRTAQVSQANIGTSSVIVRAGGQLWTTANVTYGNNLTLTGHGFSEVAGGAPATGATAADGSTIALPSMPYAGIGAVRMESGSVLAGNITLNGDAKVNAHATSATIAGSITRTNASDTFIVGGSGSATGSNVFLTGDASGLGRIWVNSGSSSTGTQTLLVGNNTASGTLGSGDVILYQDSAASFLRFQRSDGYTFGPGQKILAAHNGTATNLSKARVISNTTGSGLTLNGSTIDLLDGANGGGLYVGGFEGGNGVNGSVLNINSGSTVEAEKLFVGDQSGVAGTVNMSGGSVTILNQVRFGHYSNNTSVFNLSGGNLSITTTPAAEPSGTGENNGTLYLGVDGTGVINHSGGTLNTAAVVLDNRGVTGGADQYNLTGSGILELRTAYGIVGRNPDAAIALGGGTLRNAGSGVDVAVNGANISASGTTVLDTNGATNKFSLMGSISGTGTLNTTGGGTIELEPDGNTTRTSVSTGAGTQTIAAVLSGSSPVTKVGSGTSTLSGTNTYNGATTVSAGRLNVAGDIASSALTVSNGGAVGGEGTAASITFGTNLGDATTLHVDPTTTDALEASGALTVLGTVNVNLSGVPSSNGDITVLKHGSTTALASNFVLANAANYRSGTFTVNANDVTLSFSKKDLTWAGTTATWEPGGTDNDWNDNVDTTPEDSFFNGDRITFDDTYITGNQTITMQPGLVPGSITVNNTDWKYTLTGGGIDGSTGIIKTGDFDLDLGGTNTFTGPVSINNGIVKITTATALGSTVAGTTVSGTGTLDIGGGFAADALNIQGEAITISGDGVAGLGAIINSGATQQVNPFASVTLAGNASVGGTSRWDIRGASSVLNLAGNKLTKVGANLVYGTVDGTITSGDVDVNAGTFAVWNGTVNGTGTFRANSGGSLELNSMVAGKFTRDIVLNGGALACTTATTTSSNISLTAASTFNNGADLILTGPITETGGPFNLTKTGGGTLAVAGTNGLTGKVNVSTGILRVPDDATLGPVPVSPVADSITLQTGGRIQAGTATSGLDVTLNPNRGILLPSGDGGFHVWTGFTMNYGGSITGPGNLTKSDGGTLNFTGIASHTGGTTFSAGSTNLTGATIASTSAAAITGGTTNVNAGTTVSTTGTLRTTTATLNINGGAITAGRFVTNDGSNTSSTINHSSGSLTVTGTDSSNTNTASFLFGHWGTGSTATNTSTYNLSGGILNSTGAELSLGWDTSNAIFNQSGGTANLLGLDLGNSRNNVGVYSLTGGTLNLGTSGITTNTNKVMNFGGGTLGAFANWSSSQAIALTGNGGNSTINTLDSVDNTTGRTITLTGALSGPGGLVKNGAGTLMINGSALYTGTTTVNGGTLAVDGNQTFNRFTANHQLTVNSGATFQVNGVNAMNSATNSIDVTANGGIINVVSGGSSAIGATGTSHAHLRNITLNGGTVNLSYSGGGTAYSGESFQLNGVVAVTGTAVSTIQYTGGGDASNSGVSLNVTGTFNVSDVTGTTAADLIVSAEIEDNDSAGDSLAKSGVGTMEVTAPNSYTGGTSVATGRLLVNNTTGSGTGTGAVSVASGAFLGGTGNVAGAATVNGTVEPGNLAVGTLSFGSTLTLPTGSTYAVQITGAGTNDKLAVTGALAASGTIAVSLSGYVPVAGNTFDIADASAITGTPVFDFSAAPLSPGLLWDDSAFAATGVISVISGDPYNAWATANGITGGKFGDHDGDGVVNLMEFATNSNAASASAGARVFAKMHSLGGDNVLTLTAAVRKNAVFAAGSPDAAKRQATQDKIKYTVEASNDLVVWNAVPVTELSSGDAAAVQSAFSPALPTLDADWEWHTFRTNDGVSIDASDYIRLSVEETN